MRLRFVTIALLCPAAILFAAEGHAQTLGPPLQLSQFLTGARSAKAKPAEKSAKPQPHRHATRRTATGHAAAVNHAPSSQPEHPTSADEERNVASALPAGAPTSAESAAPLRTSPAEEYVDGVRIVPANEFNELDAAADQVKIVPADEFNELDAAADQVKVVPADEVKDIDLAAGPPVSTDGRSPDAAELAAQAAAEPATQTDAGPFTWPRLLAFGLGGPLLIGLFAWPLVAHRRRQDADYFRRQR